MTYRLEIIRAPAPKKYKAVLYHNDIKVKTSSFGQHLSLDYTLHQPSIRDKRRDAYIARHKKEDHLWSFSYDNLMTPSFLSRYLLWQEDTLLKSAKYIENKLPGLDIVIKV